MASSFPRKALSILTACSVAVLVACGGGSTRKYDDTVSLTSQLTSALAAIAANPADFSSFLNLLDSGYLQDGLTSADLSAMLAADAAALPKDVAFPSVKYSDPVVDNCNLSNQCDLTVTATNADADAVSVTIKLRVVPVTSGFKLIGDQSKG
jgi:hypothetical protein